MECIKVFKAELTQWFEVAVTEEVLKNVRSSRSYDVTTPPPDELDSDFKVSRPGEGEKSRSLEGSAWMRLHAQTTSETAERVPACLELRGMSPSSLWLLLEVELLFQRHFRRLGPQKMFLE